MAISVEGIEKIKNVVMKQVMEKNSCLIIGPEDLINRFCEDTGIKIDYLMADSLSIDNEIESEPVKMYNARSKEVFLLSLTDRDSLVDVITTGRRMTGMAGSDKEENTLLKHLVGVELVKKRYRDGYLPSADVMCADSEQKKIEMISNIFRVPPKETIDEMRTLLKDRSIIELDKKFDSAVKGAPHIPHGDPHERLDESLGINEKRADKLQKLLIKFSGKSTSAGKLAGAKEINDMNHETLIGLLEKEKGVSNREKLYLAFNQGMIMEKISVELNEKFFHLEQDNDERIKSIGKKYATEIRKSDTIIKIDNLKELNLREKLKSALWAGIYNARFYSEEDRKSVV